MSSEGLSSEVKQFLRTHIQSLEQLEILAVIRPEPERDWTAKLIYDAILSNENSIEGRLKQFMANGLLEETGNTPLRYRYAPASGELDRAVQQTLQAYKQRRVLVTETIFRPEEDPAKSFADAFRFKQT